jgi:hypothetical protein
MGIAVPSGEMAILCETADISIGFLAVHTRFEFPRFVSSVLFYELKPPDRKAIKE